MRCPFCGWLEDKVIDSRTSQSGETIRRRRQCLQCEKRYTTYERLEELFPQIVKRDGSRQEYDRAKIRRGLKLACSKRPISAEQIDGVIAQVEAHLMDRGAREIPSDQLGLWITDALRQLDPVAYLRFASVYRAFSDIESFLLALREMKEEEESP